MCCGLLLSALGDALLVWETQLLSGMGAFALAHVAYLAALGGRPRAWRRGALCAAAAALYVRSACGGARGLLAALLPLYAALLAAMAWRALARGGAAAAGGLLFLVSDAILGYSLFSGPVPHRQVSAESRARARADRTDMIGDRSFQVLVMSTYYLGQLGLALSALRVPAAA